MAISDAAPPPPPAQLVATTVNSATPLPFPAPNLPLSPETVVAIAKAVTAAQAQEAGDVVEPGHVQYGGFIADDDDNDEAERVDLDQVDRTTNQVFFISISLLLLTISCCYRHRSASSSRTQPQPTLTRMTLS